MRNALLLLLIVTAASGCTSLKSISNMAPVYEETTRGNFDDFPYCMVEKLESHHSWRITGARYDMRVNQRRQTTTVSAAAKQDQNYGIFIMEVRQTDSDHIHIALRAKSAKQYEIREAISAANRCL